MVFTKPHLIVLCFTSEAINKILCFSLNYYAATYYDSIAT